MLINIFNQEVTEIYKEKDIRYFNGEGADSFQIFSKISHAFRYYFEYYSM